MATSLTCYPTPHKMGRFEATPVIDDCGAVGLSTCPSRRGDDKSTVRVDVENDGLLYAMRRRRDARELELAEKVAAARHLALTLVYLDEHTLSRPGTLPVTQPSRPRPNQPCRPLWPSVCSTRCHTDPVCIQTGVPPARYRSWPSTGHHISSPNLPTAEIRRFEANLYAIASPLDFYPSLLDSIFPRASPVPPADSYCPHHA